MFSFFRNRNFSLLFSGQFVSQVGNSLFLIALPWFVYSQTGSKADLAITGFAQSLPGIAGLFAGVLVDRWSKRGTMIGSDTIRLILALLLFFVSFFHGSFYYIVALVLLLQFVGTFFNPASSVMIPLIVEADSLPSAMGLSQSSYATAMLIGQVGGGTLLTLLNAPLLFLFDGLTFAVSVLSLGFIRVKEPARQQKGKSSLVKEWKSGMALIVRSKMILLITSAALLANFGFAAFDIILTAWVKGPLHANAFGLGLTGGAFAVGMILGGVLLGLVTRKVSLRLTLLGGLVLSGVLTIIVGLIPNLWWDAGLLALTGIANGILNGALGTMAMTVIPEAMRGRVFGTLNGLSTLATPLGMATFGGLMVYLPLNVLFFLMASIGILSGLSFLLPVRDDLTNLRADLGESQSGSSLG